MNVDVNVNVKLDLSSLFVEMLWNVLVRVPDARDQALGERIDAAVELAVQNRLRTSRPATPSPVAPEPLQEREPAAEEIALPVQPAAEPEPEPKEQIGPEQIAAKRKPVILSDEREVLLRHEYAAGMPNSELLVRLNAMDGPPLDNKGLRNAIYRRGLRRLDRAADTLAEPGAEAPPEDKAAIVEPEPEPEPVPVQPSQPTLPIWSIERVGVLEFYYPAGDSLPDILDRLNAFPGPVITDNAIKAQIVVRGLRRDPPLPVAAPRKTPDAGTVPTDDATIRRWAGERGLCSAAEPIDIARINAKRAQLGLPLFTRGGGLKQSGAAMRPGVPR